MKARFTHRKPSFYVFFGIYVFLSAFIIFESCLPSGPSRSHSAFVTDIYTNLVNFFSGPQKTKLVEPTSLELESDSSYLGENDEHQSQVAIGTTSLFTFKATFPKKDNSEKYNSAYSYTPVEGESNNYVITISDGMKDNFHYIYLRVTANEIDESVHKLKITAGENKEYIHSFVITELQAPSEYEMRLTKSTLEINETTTIETKLIGKEKEDTYLRRYFDFTKLCYSSDDPSIANIDKNGTIYALNPGSTIVHYGNYSFPVSVGDTTYSKASSMDLSISESSNSSLYLLDYDYIFEKNEDPNNYSILVYADMDKEDNLLFEISDPLIAKLAPHHYDEEGYPVYKDEDNKPCVRLSGYRKEGETTLTCTSTSNVELKKTLTVKSEEALAKSMTLSVKDKLDITVNETKAITASFTPKNTHNHRLHVASSDNNVIEIANNDSTTISLKGLKVGKCQLTFTSLSNEELSQTIEVNVKAETVVNSNNYNDFYNFIRKFAGHFSLFLITAIFGFIFYYQLFEEKKLMWALIFSLSAGLFFAGLSEIIQAFIPSRNGAFLDVGIDFLGYLIGTMITVGVFYLIKYIKKKKQHKLMP